MIAPLFVSHSMARHRYEVLKYTRAEKAHLFCLPDIDSLFILLMGNTSWVSLGGG